ncbi:hypothetical protein [Thalassobaculum litoreum]|uniref:Replication initiation factor n=1 Tax=Thalassobaculum litoreum DSM 18839 TaxID=1123362 RepID=A0A8G2BMP2_9PROT|nr:hypothetical protein [Thalassobaculum litoreum]SDG57670.1 hypothetical protein SAMN05660686_04906 [Thalassobaculum litoreum DSM 18839]
MRTIYSGFDNLDVSYKGHISDAFLAKLEDAKARAIEVRSEILIEHGGIRMHVAESGGAGGYPFRCDTGPLGGTWFFRRPNPKDPWTIRFSAKSLTVSQFGVDGTRAQIEDTLHALGCMLHPNPESIGRVDFAVDILAPGFELQPDNFVLHARMGRSDHAEVDTIQSHGRSGRYTSVTAGTKNRRQVIVYDKRLEVTNKPLKAPWFKIWEVEMTRRGIKPLNFKDRHEGAVWRVEARAGKQCLKDQHDVTSWSDLHREIKTIFETVLDKIRYTHPNADTNRSRWPEHRFWDLARAEVSRIELDRTGLLDQERILEASRVAQAELLRQQLVGLAASEAALTARNDDDPARAAVETLQETIRSNGEQFRESFERAKGRYAHFK